MSRNPTHNDDIHILRVSGSIPSISTLVTSRRRSHTTVVHNDDSGEEVATITFLCVESPRSDESSTHVTVTRIVDAGVSGAVMLGVWTGGEETPSSPHPPSSAAALSLHNAILGPLLPHHSVDYPPHLIVVPVDNVTGVFHLHLYAVKRCAMVMDGKSPPAKIAVRAAVSLGSDCTVAQSLRQSCLRQQSLPLDWVRSNPWGVHRLVAALHASDDVALSFTTALTHVEGTNMYHTISSSPSTSTSTTAMLLDGNFGLVSTGEEAVKLQRRLLRLKGRATPALGDDDLVGALLFVHVAQTQPAEHMYATVDGRMAGMDDADLTDTSSLPVAAWRQLHDTCKVLNTMQHHDRSLAIFLCCNLFAESFTIMEDGLLLVHCSMGCGNTWTSTSARLAEILSSLFVHR